MVGFMAVTWVASSWAHNAPSIGLQYAGLALSVAAHAVLFTLLLSIAEPRFPGISQQAGLMTIAVFAVLSAVVWYTGANFNFLGPILWAGGIAALAAIVLNIFMPGSLGPWFSGAMIVLASGYILYDTSRIMREYPTTAYVGASLELFGAVAMLFWYIVRLLMQLKDGD
jgi:FtsH-binding integral membrane protein